MKQTWRNPSNFEAQKFRGGVFVDGSVYLATDGKHIPTSPFELQLISESFRLPHQETHSWVGGEMIQLDYIICFKWVGSTNMTDIPGYSWTSIQRLAKRSARPVGQKSFLGRQIHISETPPKFAMDTHGLSTVSNMPTEGGWFKFEEKKR